LPLPRKIKSFHAHRVYAELSQKKNFSRFCSFNGVDVLNRLLPGDRVHPLAVLGQHGQVPQHLSKRFNFPLSSKKYLLLKFAFGIAALFIEMWNINEMKVFYATKYQFICRFSLITEKLSFKKIFEQNFGKDFVDFLKKAK
jgi:hypothetical protein